VVNIKIDKPIMSLYGIMASPVYRLELLVLDDAVAFYPPLGTKEQLSGDNAGYDLKIVVDVKPHPTAYLVPLGVKARMVRISEVKTITYEEDCHFSLEPRSSIYKYNYMMANGRGVIDRSYRGQLMAPMLTVGDPSKSMCVEAGTRLFQIVAPDMGYISEVHYVSELSGTARGEGGFGSTGTK
jgi:dUTP pyrophosphatase